MLAEVTKEIKLVGVIGLALNILTSVQNYSLSALTVALKLSLVELDLFLKCISCFGWLIFKYVLLVLDAMYVFTLCVSDKQLLL